MFGIGTQEMAIIGLLALVIFGSGKLSRMTRDLGGFVHKARAPVDEFESELTFEEARKDSRERREKDRESKRRGLEGGYVDGEGDDRWRRRRGFDVSRPTGSFVEVARGVLIEPAWFFAELRESREEERGTGALLFALVCFASSLILGFLAATLYPLLSQDVPNPLFDVFSRGQGNLSSVMPEVAFRIGLGTIGAVLAVYLTAAIQHLFVLLFVRERRGFWATFLVVAYQSAVWLVSWVPVLGLLVNLYGIYVVTVGLREMHGTTTGRALLAVIVPYVLPLAWSFYTLWPLSPLS